MKWAKLLTSTSLLEEEDKYFNLYCAQKGAQKYNLLGSIYKYVYHMYVYDKWT